MHYQFDVPTLKDFSWRKRRNPYPVKLPVFKVDPTKNQEQIPSSFSTSQTEDRSRIQDLFQVLRFESAVNTIERDLLQQSQAGHSSTHRQLLGSVLHRQLSARLSEAGLTPEEIPVQERPSVIFPPQHLLVHPLPLLIHLDTVS